MYGCAMGVSVAAAIEIVYWIILKPFVKMMDNGRPPSKGIKLIAYLLYWITFLFTVTYWVSQFYNVYKTYVKRQQSPIMG